MGLRLFFMLLELLVMVVIEEFSIFLICLILVWIFVGRDIWRIFKCFVEVSCFEIVLSWEIVLFVCYMIFVKFNCRVEEKLNWN